jgi:hypothetical protein
MAVVYYKRPKNITNLLHSEALPKFTQIGIFGSKKIPSGNPAIGSMSDESAYSPTAFLKTVLINRLSLRRRFLVSPKPKFGSHQGDQMFL